MNSWLTVLGVVPLVGAVLVATLGKGRELFAKQHARAPTHVVLVLTPAAWVDIVTRTMPG